MTAPQTGSPATGGTSQGGGAPTVIVNSGSGDGDSKTQRKTDAVQGIVDRLVGKYGTLEAALSVLASEQWEYRETIRQRDEKIATLEAKQIPADSVVLTGEDKKAWDAVKALNVPAGEIAGKVKRAGELEAEKSEQAFGQLVDKGAASVKYNPAVLRGLLKDKGYALEMRDVVVDGKTTQQPYVRKANDTNAAWEMLTTAAERDFKDYLPALKAVPQGGTTDSAGGSSNGTEQGFVSHDMPIQSASSGSQGEQGGTAVERHLKRVQGRAERPNPLLRPAAKKD